MVGKQVAHYSILEKLGEGGMGVVYKARDTHLDRFVAIKVLPPEKVADAGRKARFVQEAKSASALNHPGIIHIYDISSDGGTDFIAMEYVAGKTLGQLIPRKGMRLNEVLKIAVQIADALARAHEAGIIHRDLKPANIMVDDHGVVKVLDFGLAKLTEKVAQASACETVTAGVKTDEGTIVGTAAYMSPEQAEGRPLDTRSDIFSFGSLLHEMVTGQRAFHGDSPISTLSAVLHREPEPLAADVPHDLRRLIARCLRKDPERRFQLMKDLRVELDELKEESSSGSLAPTPAAARAKRLPLVWALLGVVAVMAAVWFWRRPQAEVAISPVPFTSMPGAEESPSFSPDGNEVAFVWDGEKQDNQDIYVKQVGMEAVSRFTSDPAAESSPAWSPDGRYIAFLRRISPGRVAVLLKPQRGGPERKVTEIYLLTRLALTGPYLTWTPDGKNLIVVGAEDNRVRAGLLLLAVDSHELRRVLPPPERGAGDTNPAVSPDGKMLAFARVSQWGTAKIHVVELGPDFRAQGAARELTNGVMPAWTAGGAEILFSWPHHPNASRIWRIAASGRAVPRQLPGVGLGSFGPVISTRERRLLFCAARGSSEDVWKVALRADTPGAPARFIASSQSDQNAEYSPDGTRIVFASDRSGSLEIWTSNSDGSDPVKLTSFGGEVVQQPHWSPDGRKIAFHADVGGNREIFVISAAGGKPERLTIDPPWNANPRWSRDGHWIYFRSDRSGRTECWKMPAGGGAAVQVTRDGGTGAQESADGRTLYFEKDRDIWRMPVEGGAAEQVIESPTGIRGWEVGPRRLYWLCPRRGGGSEVRYYDFAARSRRLLLSVPEAPGFGVSLSPDGGTLLFTLRDPAGSDLMLVENFR